MRLIAALMLWAALSAPAWAAWNRAESNHFVIYSDGSEKDLRRYAERLEAVHWLMKAATAVDDTGKIVKVRVYLVPDVDDVKRLVGRPGSDIAGYYEPRVSGAIAVVPRNAGGDGDFTGQVVLFHEYAHHFMLQYSPVAYPAWYVEGFAEIVSTASFERKGFISYGRAASHRQYEIQQMDWIPMQRLIDGSYRKMSPEALGGFYGQSWLVAHYLTFGDKRPGQLRSFIAATNQGVPPTEAAKVFGDMAQFQRDVRSYSQSGVFPYRAPALPAGLGSETVITPVPPGEAATIYERIELDRRADAHDYADKEKDAAAKAARASWMAALATKVARLGDDPDALQLLADAQCLGEEWDACAASADKVLARAPGRWTAMLRKGEAMMHAKDAKFAVARDWIVKANRAAPDAPEPLIAYYESFAREGRAAPAVALDGLIQAMNTVPQEPSVRLQLAQALIYVKRTEDARFILKPLAFSPHDGGAREAAQAMLDGLDGKPATPENGNKK